MLGQNAPRVVLSLLLVAAIGCGGGGDESPKVENPNLKPKSVPLKNKPGDSGESNFKAT